MLTHNVREPLAVDDYLAQVRRSLADAPPSEQERLCEEARARVDLELELANADSADEAAVRTVLRRLGEPAALALQLRGHADAVEATSATSRLAPCRACRREVSREAMACPHCGAPKPAEQRWSGFGYEWKSKQTVWGLPLVHVAWGRDAQGKMRVAKGIIAIGQFGVGGIVIAQFGAGAVLGLGQFVVAPISIAQFAIGLIAVGQFALGVLLGIGMIATGWKTIAAWALGKTLGGH